MFNKPENEISHKERELGKRIVHASNYGMGAGKLAELSGMSYHESEEKMNLYHVHFPKIRIWHMAVEAQLKKTRVLTTPIGRKRMFFGRWNKALLRDAYAYVPQSTVADLTLKGMVNLYKKLPKDCDIVFNIHDEVVIQVPIEPTDKWKNVDKKYGTVTKDVWISILKGLMTNCMSIPLTINNRMFTIPVGVKTGMNWNEVS